MGKQWKQWQTIILGSKITADGDCSHKIKRCLDRKSTRLNSSLNQKASEVKLSGGRSSAVPSTSEVLKWSQGELRKHREILDGSAFPTYALTDIPFYI